MGCHAPSNNTDTNPGQRQHGSHGGAMGLLMALCCLAPLAIILAVTALGVPFSGILSFAAVLLCPLMMVFMMAGDRGHGSAEAHRSESERVATKTDIGPGEFGMLTIDLDPVLFHLWPLALSWYGLVIAAAIFVCFRITVGQAGRRGIDTDPVADLLLWVVIGGLLGGRLLHVIDRWGSYAADPM
jgi:hypothetical protein